MFLEQVPRVSHLTVLIASGAAIMTALVGLITAILARIDNGRHWKVVEDSIKREGEVSKERDASTKELLSGSISNLAKRIEDLTKSLSDRLDAQTQMIAANLNALESKVSLNHATQETAMKAAETNLALKVELGQLQITTKLGELRAASEAKVDSAAKDLFEKLKTEISTLQTNNQKLEEQQKRILGWFRKRDKEALTELVPQE